MALKRLECLLVRYIVHGISSSGTLPVIEQGAVPARDCTVLFAMLGNFSQRLIVGLSGQLSPRRFG